MEYKGIRKQEPEANIWDKNRELRRLHNEELDDFYHSRNIVRLIKFNRLGATCNLTRMKEVRGVFKILTGKPRRKMWTKSGTGLTQPSEDNWVATCLRSSGTD